MKSQKLLLLEAAKWLCVLALLIALVFQLASNQESQTDFQTMSAAVTAAADLSSMAEGSNQTLKRLYGLDAGDYDGVLLYYPSINMGAEELLLLKLSEPDQQEIVKEAISQRLSAQLDSFEGYGVEQCAMLERSIIEVQGNYILFVSAEDPSAVQEAFLDAL